MIATPAFLTITWLIPLSIWWLTQLFVLSTAAATVVGPMSLQALHTLLLVQLLSVCLFAPHWAHPKSLIVRNGSEIAASILPSWPLIAMLWLATGVSAAALGSTQLLVAIVGLALLAIAHHVRRVAGRHEVARILNTSLGLIAATLAWLYSDKWLQWATQ